MAFKLTPMELLVLILSDKGYSLRKIADVLDVDESMLEDVVRELVRKGYAFEERKRKLFGSERRLVLTREGKNALSEIKEMIKDILDSVKGMVDKGNIDGARAFLARYVEYLPYAPLLGVATKEYVDNLIRKMGYVPAYAPPEEVYEEEGEWASWEEEL